MAQGFGQLIYSCKAHLSQLQDMISNAYAIMQNGRYKVPGMAPNTWWVYFNNYY